MHIKEMNVSVFYECDRTWMELIVETGNPDVSMRVVVPADSQGYAHPAQFALALLQLAKMIEAQSKLTP